MSKQRRESSDRRMCVIVLIISAIVMIPMLFQMGVLRMRDVPFLTTVSVTSTDNVNIQLETKGTALLSGPWQDYDALPIERSQFGSYYRATWWFIERYSVNGTWQQFEHGPFTIYFIHGSGLIQVIELNQNNVTIRELS